MVKILKRNGKTYIALEGNYNIIEVGEGLYIVFSQEKLPEFVKNKLKEKNQKEEKKEKKENSQSRKTLNEREIELLIKVSLIRFVNREWEKVMSSLSKGEQIILKSLIKRGFVKVLKKNGKQFISFTEDMYEKLKQETKKRVKKEKNKPINIENSFFIIPKEYIKSYTKDLDLSKYSYVVDSEGTLFIADKKKAKPLIKKIIQVLKKGKMSFVEVGEKLNIKEEIALILLKLMCEEGLVYEPEKNVYEVVI